VTSKAHENSGTPEPRPRPQYGEYAPPGWVSPVAPPPEAKPVDLPPPAPAPTAPPQAVRRARGWDRSLTIGLLVAGLFGALIGWMTGSTIVESLPLALEQYGVEPGPMPEWLDAAGTALVASHLLLYLLAIGLSIARLRAGRPAFWAPLAAGIIAAIIFWTIMSAAVAPYVEQMQL
jgi:hypothetical protein